MKLFYYQTFLKLGIVNIRDMAIKKIAIKNGLIVLVYASAGSKNGVFLLVARKKFESSSYRIKSWLLERQNFILKVKLLLFT